jgi:transcriptional antiterminator RfaH
MVENWYAARTIVGREARAAARLTRYETFLPLTLSVYSLFGRRKERQFPLFPGYFFLRCEPDLRPTRRDEFWGLLGSERPGIGEPLAIDEEIIQELRGAMDGGYIRLPERFQAGQRVEITDGAFIYRTGLYQGQTAQERAVILLSIVGGFQGSVEVPVSAVRLAEVQ